jgi:3D (Asp-Asp-Asp) domain-containing protein
MLESIILAAVLFFNPVIHDVKTTGYCPGPPCVDPKWADGKTATNTEARRGVCASDWKVFPRGAVLSIPGYGICTVEDNGNPKYVNGLHLDLFFDTADEARQWGVRPKLVTVISWPKGR